MSLSTRETAASATLRLLLGRWVALLFDGVITPGILLCSRRVLHLRRPNPSEGPMLPLPRHLRHEIHVIFRSNPCCGLRLAADQVRRASSRVVTQAMAHRFILYYLIQDERQITPEMMNDVLDLFEWFLATPSIPTWMLNELRKVSRRHARQNLLAELISDYLAEREHTHMRYLLAACVPARAAA